MPVLIHDISIAVPKIAYPQTTIRDVMKRTLETDRKTQAILHRVYSQSGIEKRHLVVDAFQSDKFPNPFLVGTPPSTRERNEIYKKEASHLFVEVGKKLLDNNPHISTDEISHIITVSCTGFYAPGPDYDLVKGLGLSPQTQRFHLGFMGCFAAFPALKMANSFCKNDKDAVVLIVSTELCSLHFQQKTQLDNIISASVFADGAAGAIISQKPSPKTTFAIDGFASSLIPKGENDMAWDIGDHGFDMTLSMYVPDIIEANLNEVLEPLFNTYNLNYQDVDFWALHPGGRAIVDKIEKSLQLKSHQIEASRKVLANYGNMSSATVLFVLNELLLRKPKQGAKILPMAFGPGLTIESGLLTVQ